MKWRFLKVLFLTAVICGITNVADAQKKKSSRKSTKRTTKSKTKTNVQAAVPTVDTTAVVVAPPPPPPPPNDSLPVKIIKKSLRTDEAVETLSLIHI